MHGGCSVHSDRALTPVDLSDESGPRELCISGVGCEGKLVGFKNGWPFAYAARTEFQLSRNESEVVLRFAVKLGLAETFPRVAEDPVLNSCRVVTL